MTRFSESWRSALLVLSLGAVLLLVLPAVLDDYMLLELAVYLVMAILSLSLALIWGYGGILCFGQSAFFGLGSYAYALAALNMTDSTVPMLLGIAVPALCSAVLGYLMFYGRLSDVYVGVITLTVTLILFTLMNSTAGPEWTIGKAALGGFNGIPGIPVLHTQGRPDEVLSPRDLFLLCGACLLLTYAGLRLLIAAKVGRVIVAIRENEARALLLGFDARRYKLLCFTIGGAIAGLSGALFANWGAFTSPTVFSLAQSVQIIIWVIVGGLGTLIGPIAGCLAIQWLAAQIGTQQAVNANLVLGAVLLACVLLLPRGIVPALAALLRHASQRWHPTHSRAGAEVPRTPASVPVESLRGRRAG